jgi:hypothetical protein
VGQGRESVGEGVTFFSVHGCLKVATTQPFCSRNADRYLLLLAEEQIDKGGYRHGPASTRTADVVGLCGSILKVPSVT